MNATPEPSGISPALIAVLRLALVGLLLVTLLVLVGFVLRVYLELFLFGWSIAE